VQYVAWPTHTWEKLRADSPGKYEAAAKPLPDPGAWFHARIHVTKQKVSVFVDHSTKPSLVIDRLPPDGPPSGKVGLWVDSKVGTFANFTIVPTK
jgi:hypothetical protein